MDEFSAKNVLSAMIRDKECELEALRCALDICDEYYKRRNRKKGNRYA